MQGYTWGPPYTRGLSQVTPLHLHPYMGLRYMRIVITEAATLPAGQKKLVQPTSPLILIPEMSGYRLI
jgi:hypothetical protein